MRYQVYLILRKRGEPPLNGVLQKYEVEAEDAKEARRRARQVANEIYEVAYLELLEARRIKKGTNPSFYRRQGLA